MGSFISSVINAIKKCLIILNEPNEIHFVIKTAVCLIIGMMKIEALETASYNLGKKMVMDNLSHISCLSIILYIPFIYINRSGSQ